MEYNVHTLPNGIRLLHVPSASAISHACIIVNAGSRDEPEGKAGLAHFIEHLIFKRTEKRSTNQILNRLESVGADLNAYTTKEYTCVHASFLNPYLDRTLDLFNDILFHSTFPEEEMDKEKSVILDEISSYLDQPEEAINDDFEDMLFAGHALGNNILGTTESVQHFTREDVINFRKANYRTNEIVVAVLGNYTLNSVINKGSKHFADVEENNPDKVRVKPNILPQSNTTIYKPIMQAHCILGTQAYSTHQLQKVPLMLLNNYFGGNGMSSVLNLQIREKYGIAYTIESNFSPLSDTGIFSIYFGTDKEKQAKALSLIFKEIKKLREHPLNEVQLQKAKNKFIGQIALGEENRIGLIISMAKSLIDHNKIDSLETVFEKINAVTTKQMAEVTDEILNIEQLNIFTFCPIEE
ncbi:insulinase family protein [Pedobacter riviphilus]|uniref:Insulinase family protein n=1 Tax=Pedobacter riviphilus TaxID=2766984 RepID=A0ABX6TF71_9SPHI|nr:MULTISPECIES: pitrilysin family protein [Pedobacter]NII84329.1 putative Zn-dependent peptidase [Pedobacter sp. SG908]NMN38756.1 putative Zn-dependent peptidase [Pedobacter sp. SG918]QNR84153.1 insulinase family protein [Pedobacter riviphilus]